MLHSVGVFEEEGASGLIKLCGSVSRSFANPNTVSGADEPANIHGGDALPGVGLGVEPLHRVQAAGAVVAPGDVQHAVQHGHPGAAAATQHVGDGRPRVALLIRNTTQAATNKQ